LLALRESVGLLHQNKLLRFQLSCVFRLTFFAALCLQVLTVADAAVSVGATVVKTGVNAVGAAVDAVLPSREKK
jgi:hypothetical protein